MAIIKSAKAIECLIPEPNDNVYMSMITHTSEKAKHSMTVYGVYVDCKNNKIESIDRIEFSLFAAPTSFYLFIRNSDAELTASTPFIKAKVEEGQKPKIEDWSFKNDEIGMYVDVGLFGNKKIYFVTSHLDAKEIKAELNKIIEKKTLVLETVYV